MRYLRLFAGSITCLCLCTTGLVAQKVAMGRFAHSDYERNDSIVNITILDQLLVRLAGETPYTFVERAAVDRIIAEQALTRVGFTRAESAARLGRLVGADMLLSGTFEGVSGRSSGITLEVIEPVRAEVVARVRIPLSSILERGRLAPLSTENLDMISRAAAPLLTEAWGNIQQRPSQVLVKLIALIDRTGKPAFQRLGERLEEALVQKVRDDVAKKILRTHRPDAATQENELRLVGLVEADDSAWNQFADHYVWGECEISDRGAVIKLHFWDGVGDILDQSYPIQGEIGPEIYRIAEEVLAHTQKATRLTSSSKTEDRRVRLGKMLYEKAKEVGFPYWGKPPQPGTITYVPEGLKDAQRLAACAIFFDPSVYRYWELLAGLRHDEAYYYTGNSHELHEVAAIEFQLSLLSRFLIGSGGKINLDPITRNRLPDQSPLKYIRRLDEDTQENFGDLYQGGNILNLRDSLCADTYIQLNKAVGLLASAADGQSNEFRQAAEFMIRTVLEGNAPSEITDRTLSALWPKLKLARALRQAWLPVFFKESQALTDLIRDYYIDSNRASEARGFDVLTPDELALALSLPPPWGTQGLAGNGSFAGKRTTMRLIAEINLKLQSANPPEVGSVIPALLNDDVASGFIRAIELNANAAMGLLESAASAGNLANVAYCLKHGAPVQSAGPAFLAAVRSHQWPAVEYLLDSGYNPAAAGSDKDSYRTGPLENVCGQFERENPPIGTVALIELAWLGRSQLVARLLKMGVVLPRGIEGSLDSSPTDAALTRVIRVGDTETLAVLLKNGAIPYPETRSSRPSYLRPVILRKDLVMLKMLLAGNARPEEFASGTSMGRGGLLTSTEWQEDHAAKLMERSLTLAARQNWKEGVEAMLAAPRLDKTEAFEPWPHQYATDPQTRAVLLRATLEARSPDARSEAPGINLVCAIAANDKAAVAAAWKNPAARSFRARSGQSPLAFAIVENRPEIARLLVEAGAPLSDLDTGGVTPLAHAAALGDVDLVRFLAAKGADLNLRAGEGNTPLGYAIYIRKEATALALIDLGASIRAPVEQPGNDPLFQAVRQNMPAVVDRLLKRGANPRAVSGGLSIFFPAAVSNNPELIQRFVSLGCDLQYRSAQGWTPLMSAIRWGADKSTEKLLALGLRDQLAADTAVDIIKNGDAELMPASAALRALHYKPNYRRCLELFDEAGQIVSSSVAQNRIFWNLMLNKSQAQVADFLKNGGDVNFRGGETPLQQAASHFGSEASDAIAVAWVKFLLAHGAKTEVTGANESRTPLMLAIYDNKTEAVRALLEHGARVDVLRTYETGNVESILSEAIRDSRVRPATVRVLLDYGAVIDKESVDRYAVLRGKMPERWQALAAIFTPEELHLLQGGR